jgi:glycosyltransferase involved in cell wall biosynthesis
VKIIHVCGWYFPDTLGGTETYVSAVAGRLRAEGHHVLVAAPDPQNPTERAYPFEGLSVYRYPIPASPTRDEAQHVTPARGAERFHEWLKRQRPDVVHFHTFVTGVGPHEIRAARGAGARVFVTTHSGSLGFLCQRGTLMQWGRQPCDGRVLPAKCAACALQHRGMPRPFADTVGLLPPSVSAIASRIPGKLGTLLGMPDLIVRNQELQRQILRDVDAFVVLTDAAHRIVASNDGVGAPLVLNRLGMRGQAAQLKQLRALPRVRNRNHLTVAYVGRFESIKGVHDLARAVRALRPTAPVRVEFRGPISNLHELAVSNELKAIVGPDAWVTFGDPIKPEQIFEYLRDIDLLCCPSRTLEGGPTVALEAMAVGTPVLGSRIGALAEILEDGVNGCLVPPNDAAALGHALARIADDPAGTIDVWRRNLPDVRTMDDVVRQYLEMYAGAPSTRQ